MRALVHVISVSLWKGLRLRLAMWANNQSCPTWWSPGRNSEHWGLDEFPQLSIPYMHCHTSMPGDKLCPAMKIKLCVKVRCNPHKGQESKNYPSLCLLSFWSFQISQASSWLQTLTVLPPFLESTTHISLWLHYFCHIISAQMSSPSKGSSLTPSNLTPHSRHFPPWLPVLHSS